MKQTIKYRGDLNNPEVASPTTRRERRSPCAQEKALAEQRRLTTERLAAVGRVSAAIAQQFNDPLQAITNVLGGIHRRGCLEQEDMPLVEMAYQEIKKLNRLARQLREFYQPTLGKTDLFNIRIELEKIIEAKRARMAGKDIVYPFEFADDFPPIQAVASQIKLVFQELLDIAIIACDKDHTINISTSLQQDTVVVQIEDSGCGINPTIISELFEPFSRAQPKKPTRDLRLAICYAIITLHGGTIEAEINDEKVTIFRVILPVKLNAQGDGTDSPHKVDR